MAKHCETFDHTADVGLDARADTLAELFEALSEGLADVVCPRGPVAEADKRTIHVEAEDVEALAVDFLCEVLAAIQEDRFALASVSVGEISDAAVTAELAGEPYDETRHEIATEVKAVTYHQLKIAPEVDHWIGRIILDL
jgi:SHS2 domain-containing protein